MKATRKRPSMQMEVCWLEEDSDLAVREADPTVRPPEGVLAEVVLAVLAMAEVESRREERKPIEVVEAAESIPSLSTSTRAAR